MRSGASRTLCLLFLFLAAAVYGTLMLRNDELFASDVAIVVASEEVLLLHPCPNAAAAHDDGPAPEPYVLAITNYIGPDTPSNEHSAGAFNPGVLQRRGR